MSIIHRVPVTNALRAQIEEIRAGHDWRVFDGDWWPASHTLAWKIANGRQVTTTPEVYRAVGLEPPLSLYVTLGAGSSLFGKIGLIQQELAANVHIVVLEAGDLEGYEMRECAVCGEEFFTAGWLTRKYCRRHDWASGWQRSPAGQRWRNNERSGS